MVRFVRFLLLLMLGGFTSCQCVNVPPRVDNGYPSDKDPHDEVRKLDVVHDQTDKFLRDGIIQSFCEGPCDPE